MRPAPPGLSGCEPFCCLAPVVRLGCKKVSLEYARHVQLPAFATLAAADPRAVRACRSFELYVRIDRCLGAGFSADRQQALWMARRRVNRRVFPYALMTWGLVLVGIDRTPDKELRPSSGLSLRLLVRMVCREWGRALSQSGVEAMLAD